METTIGMSMPYACFAEVLKLYACFAAVLKLMSKGWHVMQAMFRDQMPGHSALCRPVHKGRQCSVCDRANHRHLPRVYSRSLGHSGSDLQQAVTHGHRSHQHPVQVTARIPSTLLLQYTQLRWLHSADKSSLALPLLHDT